MRKVLIIGLLIISWSIGHSQAITDSTIAMIAYWEIGDEVTYEFKEIEDKLSKGEKTLKTTTYDVVMSIIDSTENSYSITWEYKNAQADYELSQMEKDLNEICGDIPIQYRTDEFGAFETIENWNEMKEVTSNIFDKWIAEKQELPDSISTVLHQMVTAMFSSKEQMNYWARDLKFFHYLYGGNLSRTTPFEGVKYYTNPFIKKVMPGTQKVTVLAVDEESYIAKILVNSGIEGDAAKALMIDFAKQNMDALGIKDESEIKEEDVPHFSVKEKIECIYDIDTGYILKGTYIRLTELNDDYKRTTYEYKIKK